MELDLVQVAYVVLAAVFKSVADTSAHHYDTSILKRWSRNFWDNSDYWHTHPERIPPKRVFGYPLDGWHLSNSLMILSFCVAAFGWTLEMVISGVFFNVVFVAFYDKIWRRKP
jgi:hypothetical protein